MKNRIKEKFISLWKEYFGGAELPIAFYYTDASAIERLPEPKGWRCIFADIARVRKGEPVCYDASSVGCSGGKRYFGFAHELREDFDYFLSCGIPGKVEGERYKKTPELVHEWLNGVEKFTAPAKYLVFKRWDQLDEKDEPDAVIFFARPDILSALFALVNFDQAEPNGVFSPFGAGCSALVQYPYVEKGSKRPRAVLGLFDVSARPFVGNDELSFAVPMEKFETMVDNMKESFLITDSWKRVQKRMGR